MRLLSNEVRKEMLLCHLLEWSVVLCGGSSAVESVDRSIPCLPLLRPLSGKDPPHVPSLCHEGRSFWECHWHPCRTHQR